MAITVEVPYELGNAHVQLDQWLGTAAAENDLTIHSEELHKLLGLDRDRWSILAIDFYDGTGVGGKSRVDVYAVDREAHDLSGLSHSKLMALAEDKGHIPVTHFKVHHTRADEIIKRVFKRYQVRLVSRGVQGHPLRVEMLDDLQLTK